MQRRLTRCFATSFPLVLFTFPKTVVIYSYHQQDKNDQKNGKKNLGVVALKDTALQYVRGNIRISLTIISITSPWTELKLDNADFVWK